MARYHYPVASERIRLSQGTAAIIAAVIVGAATFFAGRTSKRDGQDADTRRTIEEQSRQIAALVASERQKDATLDQLKHQLASVQNASRSDGLGAEGVTSTAPARSNERAVTPHEGTAAGTKGAPALIANAEGFADQGFDFSRPSCERHADRVTCRFMITNREAKPRPIAIGIKNTVTRQYDTGLKDSRGNQIFATRTEATGHSAEQLSYMLDARGHRYPAIAGEIAGVDQEAWEQQMLPPGLAVAAAITFQTELAAKSPATLAISVVADRINLAYVSNVGLQ